MGTSLHMLMLKMNELGLHFRQVDEGIALLNPSGARVPTDIHESFLHHEEQILGCLGFRARQSENPSELRACADHIHLEAQVRSFFAWIEREASWIKDDYKELLSARLLDAVSTGDSELVLSRVHELQEEIIGLTWAAEI